MRRCVDKFRRTRWEKDGVGERKGVTEMAAHLDDFCHAVGKLSLGECFEERCVNEDVFWLPERSNEVLSVRGVNGRLSANARVDHGEEGGGDLHKANTTHAIKDTCK